MTNAALAVLLVMELGCLSGFLWSLLHEASVLAYSPAAARSSHWVVSSLCILAVACLLVAVTS